MNTYAGFEIICRRASVWIARRRTKEAIYQLAPARSRREIEAAIDRHNSELSWEELVAA